MACDGKKSDNKIKDAVNRIFFKNDHKATQDCEEREEVK